ncbi:MAG TPA: folate-binding protein [Acidobacteriaceae bacterium]|nr:folate-binding protein [Acidobacteriaceae bacterium]
MQDTFATTPANSADAAPTPPVSAPTALAHALGGTATSLQELAGGLTFSVFNDLSQELAALVEGTGAFDLGYRGQIAVGSADRVRWLNGMLTNNIQQLAEGHGNYSFVLNAQGRILGDCDAYSLADHLLVMTDRSQIPALMAHFDRFIIMDDVTLEEVSAASTALGLAGPLAPQLLAALGVALPASTPGGLWLMQTRICGVPVQLTGGYPAASSRFELWCANENVRMLWDVLLAAGALPCGIQAAEALRVLEATPRYGVDLGERYLPQETSQTRALHFSKGCYLGQEIVERIRSRGAVHRCLAQFTLSSHPAVLPLELTAAGENAVAGRITSSALFHGTCYGLGVVRTEVVVRSQADADANTFDYPGGAATLVIHPPLARTAPQSS